MLKGPEIRIPATRSHLQRTSKWVWVKIRPLGIGPQVLAHVSIYRVPVWVPIFDPQPSGSSLKPCDAYAVKLTSRNAKWWTCMT